MDKQNRLVPFSVKAAGSDDGLEDGQFEGYASVFGNTDSYGDIVVKGAFDRTLKSWGEKGDPIPLLWGHDLNDPFSNIGTIDSAEEDDRGLKVRGTFDLDNPKAAQVYKLAKGRRTTGMSFAYAVNDSEQTDDGNLLKDLDLFEASIVPIGANPEAGVLAVKANAEALEAATKDGRLLASKHIDSLQKAYEAIGAVLAASGDQEEASGKPEVKAGASDEELEAKSPALVEEPKAGPSVDAFLAAISIQEREI